MPLKFVTKDLIDKGSILSDNGFASNRRKAIIWREMA